MNDGPAASAPPLQDKPTDEGNIVAIRDHLSAFTAMGARPHHGLTARQARNANIQEAAEGQARESAEDGRNHRQKMAGIIAGSKRKTR